MGNFKRRNCKFKHIVATPALITRRFYYMLPVPSFLFKRQVEYYEKTMLLPLCRLLLSFFSHQLTLTFIYYGANERTKYLE